MDVDQAGCSSRPIVRATCRRSRSRRNQALKVRKRSIENRRRWLRTGVDGRRRWDDRPCCIPISQVSPASFLKPVAPTAGRPPRPATLSRPPASTPHRHADPRKVLRQMMKRAGITPAADRVGELIDTNSAWLSYLLQRTAVAAGVSAWRTPTALGTRPCPTAMQQAAQPTGHRIRGTGVTGSGEGDNGRYSYPTQASTEPRPGRTGELAAHQVGILLWGEIRPITAA